MTKADFIRLMKIPNEWEAWDMYPDALFVERMERFESIHADSPEHDRNGMFHWWLRRNPTSQQLLTLASLTFLDPDTANGSGCSFSHPPRSKL